MTDDGGEATDEISYAGRVVAIAFGGNSEIKKIKSDDWLARIYDICLGCHGIVGNRGCCCIST